MKMEYARNRRTFIKSALLFCGSALLLALGRPAVSKPTQTLPQPEPSSQGYRLMEHIKRYYRTASL